MNNMWPRRVLSLSHYVSVSLPAMEIQGINLEIVAKLHGITVEQARELVEASLAETRQTAEAFLAEHPELRQRFELEYEREKSFYEQRGLPIPEHDAFLRGRALSYEMRNRFRVRRKKVKASEVAAEFGGELPKGWDDLLPPDLIERDTKT